MPILTDWLPHDEGAIYVVTPSAHLLSAKARAFIDWIAEQFVPLPPWLRDAAGY